MENDKCTHNKIGRKSNTFIRYMQIFYEYLCIFNQNT